MSLGVVAQGIPTQIIDCPLNEYVRDSITKMLREEEECDVQGKDAIKCV